MTHQEFEKIVENRISVCKNILLKKKEEYASDVDRLQNFKDAARISNYLPEETCVGFWLKHVASIFAFVEELSRGIHRDNNYWAEKLTDAHNYLYLLEGLLQERYRWE